MGISKVAQKPMGLHIVQVEKYQSDDKYSVVVSSRLEIIFPIIFSQLVENYYCF